MSNTHSTVHMPKLISLYNVYSRVLNVCDIAMTYKCVFDKCFLDLHLYKCGLDLQMCFRHTNVFWTYKWFWTYLTCTNVFLTYSVFDIRTNVVSDLHIYTCTNCHFYAKGNCVLDTVPITCNHIFYLQWLIFMTFLLCIASIPH